LTLLPVAIAYRAALILSPYIISIYYRSFIIFASCARNAASFTIMLVSGAITLASSLLATLVPHVINSVSFMIMSVLSAGKALKSITIAFIPHVIKAVMLMLLYVMSISI